MPAISILTPVFANSPDKVTWLGETIESVLSQSFTGWEMLILDDASPLLIGEIKEHYTDPRLRWFRSGHQQGPSLCRNTLAALAVSEALLALDADDKLASPDVLGVLYEEWNKDRTKIVYGDLQPLTWTDGNFTPGKVLVLGDYTFNRVLNPSGLFPVTALHSKACHAGAGGWKKELDAGLEDVEYWIAAGKAGFCGEHIRHTTLLYRKHQGGRAYELRRVNMRETEMRNKIRQLHQDVYDGRYPEMCCGGGVRVVSGGSGQASANTPAVRFATLDQVDTSQKTWVQYIGLREASFGVEGKASRHNYTIDGKGATFEVANADLPFFARSGRGKDFKIGVPPPKEYQPPQAAAQPANGNGKYVAPAPELAVIERLDAVAAQAGAKAQPQPPHQDSELAFLGNVHIALDQAGYSLQKLASASPSELIGNPHLNIGLAQAARVINQAKQKLGVAVSH